MPSRIIREGINSSARINALSFGAELFYRRLMSAADDHGRFYAAPATLRGACWPTAPGKVTEEQISEWLQECALGDKPLILLYEIEGCQYLQIANFGQQMRSKSKFPAPVNHLQTDAKQLLSTCESPVHASRSRISESDSYSKSGAVAAPAAPKNYAMDELYPELRRVAREFYESSLIDPEDFYDAFHEWNRLDMDQRHAAIAGMVALQEAGADPVMTKRLRGWLKGHEWKRRANGRGNPPPPKPHGLPTIDDLRRQYEQD